MHDSDRTLLGAGDKLCFINRMDHRRLLPQAMVLFALVVGCQACGTTAISGNATHAPTPTTARTQQRTPAASTSKLVFDAAAVEEGVYEILTEKYDFADVGSVACPEDQDVEPGKKFECVVEIGGKNERVTITPRDYEGEYEVSQPTR
jgi:hypothetical protein